MVPGTDIVYCTNKHDHHRKTKKNQMISTVKTFFHRDVHHKALSRNKKLTSDFMSSTSTKKLTSSLETEQTAPESCFDLETSKVRFLQKVEEYSVLARHCYSEREMRHCWYTEEEKEKYRERHIRSAQRLENGERSKRGESFRGLEGWTQDGGQEANDMVQNCVLSVLREQELLWKQLKENPDRLAFVSKSTRSVRLAIRAAKKDTSDAVKAYQSMGIECIDFESGTIAVSSLISSSLSGDSGTHSPPGSPQGSDNQEKRRFKSRRWSSLPRDSDNESQESRKAEEKKERRRPSSRRRSSSSRRRRSRSSPISHRRIQ